MIENENKDGLEKENEDKTAVKETKKIELNKKNKIIIAISLAVIIAVAFFGGIMISKISFGRKYSTLNWGLKQIEKKGFYMEDGERKDFSASDYLKILTTGLDDFSEYYTKEECKQAWQDQQGNVLDFGFRYLLDLNKGEFSVNYLDWNSPAEKAGFLSGDIFVGVYKDKELKKFDQNYSPLDFENESQDNISYTYLVKRGESEIELSLKKEKYSASYVRYYDNEKALSFIENEDKDGLVASISDNGMENLDNDTAYISFKRFMGNVTFEIEQSMNYLATRNKKKLILDLRDNGGGLINVLSNVASYFVEDNGQKNSTIAIAKFKDGKQDIYKTTGNYVNKNIEKIIVLANDGTASASETLMGAMLHYGVIDSSSVVIEKHRDDNYGYVASTYGKGVMQETITNFMTGEAIKLTTAYIYYPDGKTNIHGKGIRTSEVNSVDRGKALDRALEILKAG